MLIDKRLFPDAKCNGMTYSNYDMDEKRIDIGKEMPVVRAFSDLDSSVCVLLCGEASVGKSIACQILNAQAMIERKHCYWFRCKHFSSVDADYLGGLNVESYEQTVIFDGYEELPDEDSRARFFELVSSLMEKGIRIVISARRDIRGDTVAVYGDGTAESERMLFADFAMIELCPFTEEQLTAIVPRETKKVDLLKNTMFLSLYLELCQEGDHSENNDVINEADLLLRYFKMLYEQKQCEENRCFAELSSLGRLIQDQRDGRSLRNVTGCIPEALQNMFSVRTYIRNGRSVRVLDSDQTKYLHFMQAWFLKEELLGAIKNGEGWDDVQDLFQISEHTDDSEAYVYAGMLLRNEPMVSGLAGLLDGYESCEWCKVNVDHLLAGYFGENASMTGRVGQK